MRMRMHSKSGIVNGLFPDRNRLVVIKVYPKKSVKPEIVNRYDIWVLRHKIGGAKVFVNNVQCPGLVACTAKKASYAPGCNIQDVTNIQEELLL